MGAGRGRCKEEVRPGDIVWFPARIRHWHGATATQGMTHIAIAEALDGKTVDWMEKMTDHSTGTKLASDVRRSESSSGFRNCYNNLRELHQPGSMR